MLAEDFRSTSQKACGIFISYMREDKESFNQLTKHLVHLQQQGFISDWHQREIGVSKTGEKWEQGIDEAINTASLIFLLVNPAFLASKYCRSREIQRALERHRAHEARVIPILLDVVDFRGTPLAGLAFLPSTGIPLGLWNKQNWGYANMDEGIIDALRDLNTPPDRTVYHKLATAKRPWNVPYLRNPGFFPYWCKFSFIHATFQQAFTDTQTRALRSGLPTPYLPAVTHIKGRDGSGKTQHAIEYAYQHRDEYDAVFWINASSRQSLALSFHEIAQALSLPERHSPLQELIIQAVLRWLHTHDRWLLIIDNIPLLEQIYPILPKKGRGSVLLLLQTTEQSEILYGNLNSLAPSSYQGFLLQRARPPLLSPYLRDLTSQDRQILRSLTETLGNFPLALSIAGAYISQVGSSLEGYRQIYRAHRPRWSKALQNTQGYDRAVHTALRTSIERLQSINPLSLEILRTCTFLHGDGIPSEILLTCIQEEKFAVNDAIKLLRHYGLIGIYSAGKISIHHMIQVALKEELSFPQRQLYARRVIRAISLLLPTNNDEQQAASFERYLLHTQICATLITEFDIATPEAIDLLHRVGTHLHYHATINESRPFLQHAHALAERVYGSLHQKVAIILGDLADLYATSTNSELIERAEEYYHRSIHIFDTIIGSDHHRIVARLTNLALLYKKQRKNRQAEVLLIRALTLSEQLLGLNHHLLAFPITNLAQLYSEQNKPGRARPLYKRAIALIESEYGTQHPQVCSALNKLAQHYIYCNQQRQALPLLRRILAISEQGDSPITIAQSLCNLARLLLHLEIFDEAEQLLQRALRLYEQIFGADHPEVRGILIQLSLLYTCVGDYTQANNTLQHVFTTWQEEWSSSSSTALLSEKDIASLQKTLYDDLIKGIFYPARD